jgi:hypothetical protein
MITCSVDTRTADAPCFSRSLGRDLGYAKIAAATHVFQAGSVDEGCRPASSVADFRYGSMLSKKSFGGGKRIFSELLMRFGRSDVRDHFASQKRDREPSYRRH